MGSNIDRLQTLQKYNIDDIQAFRETKHSDVISQDMQEYILQMDTVATILRRNRLSIRDTIEALQRAFPTLTFGKARAIYYDALDYFYVDDSVSARSWDLVYAEKLEDLSLLAIQANKLDVAFKCTTKAHELRTKQREAMDFSWKAPTYLVNINVRPEDLGYTSQTLADIAKRNEDRKYKDMILSLETTEAEKKRLLTEAGIAYEDPKPEADEQ